MRPYFLEITLLCFLAHSGTFLMPASETSETKRDSFNENWLYFHGNNEDARFPESNDEHWVPLNLPHTKTSEFSTARQNGLIQRKAPSVCWYRKHFKLPDQDRRKSIQIQFEGASGIVSVWINGHFLGKSSAAETGLLLQLNPFVRFGDSSNVLSVRLEPLGGSVKSSEQLSLNRNVWLESELSEISMPSASAPGRSSQKSTSSL